MRTCPPLGNAWEAQRCDSDDPGRADRGTPWLDVFCPGCGTSRALIFERSTATMTRDSETLSLVEHRPRLKRLHDHATEPILPGTTFDSVRIEREILCGF